MEADLSSWTLVQIFFNVVMFGGIVFVLARLSRPAKDDPRLSKGLQLLQSKISVLEDLADRTDAQVKQLNALIDQKVKDIHFKIEDAEKMILQIEQSKSKSLEVAKIFQDKIPHKEIIERQNTIKYVKAARLAHQGLSVDEIAAQVDISRGEIEMIAKVNKGQLMFDNESLPEWIEDSTEDSDSRQDDFVIEKPNPNVSPVINKTEALKNLGDKFRTAMNDQVKMGESLEQVVKQSQGNNSRIRSAPTTQVEVAPIAPVTPAPIQQPKFNGIEANNQSGKRVMVQKISFPRIEM